MLFIRQGLYQEGVFKFTLTIPENYPDGDCPVSYISATISLLTLLHSERPKLYTILAFLSAKWLK